MRTFLISAATFILGAAAGGSAIAWAYNEFLIQPTAMSTQTYEATINLTALNALREGKPDIAAATLENALDGNLIALGFYPENKLSDKATSLLKKISSYRASHPFQTLGGPEVEKHISVLLSKHGSAIPSSTVGTN